MHWFIAQAGQSPDPKACLLLRLKVWVSELIIWSSLGVTSVVNLRINSSTLPSASPDKTFGGYQHGAATESSTSKSCICM